MVFINGSFTIIFDEISAVALHWDYPSIVGPPLQLLAKLIIVAQIITYQKSYLKNNFIRINSNNIISKLLIKLRKSMSKKSKKLIKVAIVGPEVRVKHL